MTPPPYLFALISESALVPPRDLHRMCSLLERNAAHCAAVWRKHAPAVVVIDAVANLPAYAQPVVFVDTDTDMDALAVHYWTPERGPAARVYVEQSSGLNTGRYSVCEAASHEILEALVDPQVNLWTDYPQSRVAGVQCALECCDPTQDTYVLREYGTDWQVANFVHPQWFDRRYREYVASAELRFDHVGRLRGPGAIGPEGYVVLRAPNEHGEYVTWLESAQGLVDGTGALPAERRAGKAHAWARTKVRLQP